MSYVHMFLLKGQNWGLLSLQYMLNIIGTPDELHETIGYLKRESKMKDLGKTKDCLGFEVEHLSKGNLCPPVFIY